MEANAEDAELVRQTVGGNRRAFDSLTVRYYRPVGGFILKRVRCPDLVEDLVQETFLEAFRALRDGRPPERFSSWLFGIAHNVCGKWLRRKRPVLFDASAPPVDLVAGPGEEVALEELEEQTARLARLEAGLAGLSEETRQLLDLKHRQGKTCEQIAAEVGRPVGTVKSLLARTYKQLRSQLGPCGGTQP